MNPLLALQGNLVQWLALSDSLDSVLPFASAALARSLLLSLLADLRQALGSRVHRIQWLHDLLFSIAQVHTLLTGPDLSFRSLGVASLDNVQLPGYHHFGRLMCLFVQFLWRCTCHAML